MNKAFLSVGAVSGLAAVALGAFAAHSLKQVASVETVEVFKTGVQYQMYHTLALLLTAVLPGSGRNNWLKWAGYFFILGIIFFSGSLYVISAMQLSRRTVPAAVGILTPIGGLLFIFGWLSLFISSLSRKSL